MYDILVFQTIFVIMRDRKLTYDGYHQLGYIGSERAF